DLDDAAWAHHAARDPAAVHEAVRLDFYDPERVDVARVQAGSMKVRGDAFLCPGERRESWQSDRVRGKVHEPAGGVNSRHRVAFVILATELCRVIVRVVPVMMQHPGERPGGEAALQGLELGTEGAQGTGPARGKYS